MNRRLGPLLLLPLLSSCASLTGGPATSLFNVYFQPYSADLDGPAVSTVQSAAAFAKSHPLQPVILVGYASPPDPGKDVPGLSEMRNAAVKAMLVQDGVNPDRISAVAKGTVDPKGSLPDLSVRRVDISVGAVPPQ
jgi:outer membrane protein OmpA-like peptidoglycan-associated protein